MQMQHSDLLRALLLTRANCAFVDIGSDRGVVVPTMHTALFALVLDGRAQVGMSGEPMHWLDRGGYALVLRRPRLCIVPSADAGTTSTNFFARRHDHDSPPTIRVGSGNPAARLLIAGFDTTPAHPLLSTLPRCVVPPAASRTEVEAIVGTILRQKDRAGASAVLGALVEYLFLATVQWAGTRLDAGAGAYRSSGGTFVPFICNIIDRSLEKRWTLALLAAAVGVSRSTLAATFTREMGMPPMAYLAQQRMLRAAELLRLGTPSGQVAWLIGFTSPAAFSRAFARHHGIAPTAFLREHGAQRADATGDYSHWATFLQDDPGRWA
jgi:AraC-like DNA-binding protein